MRNTNPVTWSKLLLFRVYNSTTTHPSGEAKGAL
jgi:hypothetical protein